MSFTSAVHGRLQFKRDGKMVGVFTISQGEDTFTILAEFQKNKWKEFWSAKTVTTNFDSEYDNIIEALFTNLTRLFTGQPATSNVNAEVVEITSRL